MRPGRGTLPLALAGLLGTAACAPAVPPAVVPAEAAAPPRVVEYTPAQAERGRQVFDTVCSACHAAGEFTGRMFQLGWRTRPIGDFFQHISTAMPQDRPGTLTAEAYASVVAYVLQLNGHPAGERELSTDAAALASLRWP